VAQILIEERADLNAQGGRYDNALQAASYWGHIEVLQMLIEKEPVLMHRWPYTLPHYRQY
jgi:hypothetical protein